MRVRLLVVSALVATTTAVPMVISAPPALAHTHPVNADTVAGADIDTDPNTNGVQDPTINSIPMKVRVLYPTTTPVESGGWPIVIYMAGQNKNRCANINEDENQTSIPSWLTRSQLAALGYVVVSFNPRGMPSSKHAGENTFTTGQTEGCGAEADAEDGLNDSGWDYAGPTDQADVSALIDWAKNFQCGSGSTCVNASKIGVLGEGYHGLLTYLMTQDSDVKAIVPIGTPHVIRNLKNISNDGAGTPVFRPVDQGWMTADYADSHAGQFGHADTSVLRNRAAFSRTTHLNPGYPAQNTNGSINISSDPYLLTIGSSMFTAADIGVGISVSSAGASGGTLTTTIDALVSGTQVRLATPALTTVTSGATVKWSLDAWDAKAFMDARAVVDDNTSVARADTISQAVFAVHGFLNGSTSTLPDIEAFTQMVSQGGTLDDNKYLYLGACGAFPAPCKTNNAASLQLLVHKFLDRHLRLDGTSQVTAGTTCAATGPCIFRAVPPKLEGSANPFVDDNWAVSESLAWPPAGISSQTYCLGYDSPATRGTWGAAGTTGATCAAASNEREDKVLKNKSHWSVDPLCAWLTYDVTPAVPKIKQKAWGSDERLEYDETAITVTDMKLLKVEASLKMKTNTARMSVYLDLQQVTSGGIPTTIWQSNAVHIPVARTVASPTTVVNFTFQPGGAAWTVAAGHTLRLGVSTKQAFKLANISAGPPPLDLYVSTMAQEELVSDYTILHTTTDPSRVKLWWTT